MSRLLRVGSRIEVIEDTWPCLIVRLPHVVDASVVEELRGLFEQVFARKQRFVLITDTFDVRGLPTATTRQHLTNWLNEPAFQANIVRFNIGSATVLTSAVMRGALTALYWFWRPASPQFQAASRVAALEWCIAKLQGESVAIPDPLAEYRVVLSSTRTNA